MVKRKPGRMLSVLGYSSMLILLCFVLASSGYGRDYKFTDAHLHYVNYVLQSETFPNLFDEMDKNRVERAVVFGLGYAVSWPDMRTSRAKYYADPETGGENTPPVYYTKMGDYRLLTDYAGLSPKRKAMIYPFLQAINVSDRNEIYYVQKMFGYHPELCGIGELMIRQGELNRLVSPTPAGDSVALDPILDFAEANHMPVLIHQNLAEEASKCSEALLDPIYVKEITDLMARHPETTVIWAHAGLSRNMYIRNHLILIKRLLAAHPNLYFDLSWIVRENSIERDLKGWADLIMAYPDRFVLGSEKIGRFKGQQTERLSESWSRFLSSQATDTGLGETLKAYKPLLQEIDQRPDGEAVSDMITYRNMNWILGRITSGCKTGKPIVDPWKGADPWKDPRYIRPVIRAKFTNSTLRFSLGRNIKHLTDDIGGQYDGGNKGHEYAGIVEDIVIPQSSMKRGVGLFALPGFANYTGFVDQSMTGSMSAQSLLFIENWDEAFGYSNDGTLFYPDGNWPTVPWWKDGTGARGSIDKVRVPEGKSLILYADEYFRGEVLRTVPATKGKFENLGDIAEKVKSFQFLSEGIAVPMMH